MLDSLVRVSRRVDNPLPQEYKPSGLLVARTSSHIHSIKYFDFKVQQSVKLRKSLPLTRSAGNLDYKANLLLRNLSPKVIPTSDPDGQHASPSPHAFITPSSQFFLMNYPFT